MIRVNEKILNTAERILSITAPTRYSLYGATKRFITCQNSFIGLTYLLQVDKDKNFSYL